MQSNKIMFSLILYVFIFIIAVFSVENLANNYYNRLNEIQKSESQSSQITKLNLYMLKTIKKGDSKIRKTGITDDENSYFITFESDDDMTTFVKKGDIIYYNQIKLCKNVDSFKIFVDRSEKESINVEVSIDGKPYNLQYVIN